MKYTRGFKVYSTECDRSWMCLVHAHYLVKLLFKSVADNKNYVMQTEWNVDMGQLHSFILNMHSFI